MSITATKRDYMQARIEAESFLSLFGGCYERWEIVGSIRRKAKDVGDIDHLVIPKIELRQDQSSMFAAEQPVNLLWERADALVSSGKIYRHVRDGGGFCWGEKYRSTIFGTTKHDVFTACMDSWGPQLAIRTGPWEFSKRLVTGLLQNGRRNIDGHVYACRPCTACVMGEPCKTCDSTHLMPEMILSVDTEEEYFELCGVTFRLPEVRR